MQQVTKPSGEQNWNASGSWGNSATVSEDDGGWSQGPPASGSGWQAGGLQAGGADPTGWGQTNTALNSADWQSPKPNIVVDVKDKEAWPSISVGGPDHSESASEASDDNASVKSGSVISVSSNQGSAMDKSSGSLHGQGSSASLWNNTPASFNGMDSGTWSGLNIPSSLSSSSSSSGVPSSLSGSGWSGPFSSLSSSNNQGHNSMQGITSIASGNGGSSSWGNSSLGYQTQQASINRPPSTVQMQTSTASMGLSATQSASGQQGAAALQHNGPPRPLAGQNQGLINMATSLSLPNVGTNSSAFHGVGNTSMFPPKSQTELSWSSLSASPTVGSDTLSAGKGISNNNQQVHKSNDAIGATSGWGLQHQGLGDETKNADGWGSVGNPGEDWGSSSASSNSQSQWGGTQNTAAAAKAPTTSTSSQWPGSTGSSGGVVGGQNPIRSQPPTWAQAAGKGLPSNPPAANNGNSSLDASQNSSGSAGPMSQQQQQPHQGDDEIQRAIECHDGWGKRPVRQDTAWDTSPVPKAQRKSSTASATAPVVEKPATNSNMWNNNSGTAIWESSKEPPASQWTSASQGPEAPPMASAQWDSANRPGAPKPPVSSQWNAPVKDANQGGAGQWTSKTEVGSWAATENSGGNTWGDQGGQARGVDDGTSLWNSGTTGVKPPNWNSVPPNANPQMPPNPGPMTPNPGAMNPNAAMIAGRQPEDWKRQAVKPNPNGWSDTGQLSQKGNDGTGMWASNQPQPQARTSGWESNQWKAKQSTSSSSSWGDEWNGSKVRISDSPHSGWVGSEQSRPITASSSSTPSSASSMYWNRPAPDNVNGFNWGEKDMIWNTSDYRKDDMMWNDDGTSNCIEDDTDMGNWSDKTQENNSTWSSATGWKVGARKNIKMDSNGTQFTGQPQMRARLLQQIMDLGFRKDEAQHALINNNMSLNHALADLYKQKGAKRDDDVFNFNDGAKPKLPGMDLGATDTNNISETHLDPNTPFVPNINSMQNTPFPNAQSQLNQFKGPSLPQSSQNNPSIMMQQQQQQQHRHIQEKFKQQAMNVPPPILPPTQAPAGALDGQGPNRAVLQQQVLQQLRLAVKSGLISPALLNMQLPTSMLVMLQQLLKYQQWLQQLINSHQVLAQQCKIGTVSHQQLENNLSNINIVKHKILQLHKEMANAQRTFQLGPKGMGNTGPAGAVGTGNPLGGANMPPPTPDVLESMTNSLSSEMVNLSVQAAATQPPPPPQQSQSKLSQWKRSDSKDVSPTLAPGGGDVDNSLMMNKAVGSKPALNHSISSPNLQYGDLGLTNLGGDPTWSNFIGLSTNQNWPSALGSPNSGGGDVDLGKGLVDDLTKKESQMPSLGVGGGINLNDSIPEFVPGKPWQGNIKTNVEDDPHITPGSFSRSYSLNMPKDEDAQMKTGTLTSDSTWSTGNRAQTKSWSGGEISNTPTSFSNEVWGVPLKSNTSRPPPGIMNKQAPSQWSGGVNRQHSWAGHTTTYNSSGWMTPTSCLLIRNAFIRPSEEQSLRMLCAKQGHLAEFNMVWNRMEALVCYKTKEDALRAQKNLNQYPFGNSSLEAELITEAQYQALIESLQTRMEQMPQQTYPMNHLNSMSMNGQSSLGGGGTDDGSLSWNFSPSSSSTVVPKNMGEGMQSSALGFPNPWSMGSGAIPEAY